ncbi:hypothetical protein N7468_010170 [Penicillium chermesinum]|uniref:Tyrosine specific protein phosphatases domain-containing protein n=1 Tax=Penicillium chermesinum TaxID=63820 RepID=A0A9W9NC63_9EURO|nr:uncharacterized protein N7468_010170 [Penicillium chermesinum]KAJ5217162.1 hypothetical protein N7468_010170 [Penicillium chermesinum]
MAESELLPKDWPPFINVDGVSNFRGLGGYVCHPPQTALALINANEAKEWRIRPGFLFRSAQPSQITPAGQETLTKTLSIHSIFDFRSDKDVAFVADHMPGALLDIPETTRYSVPVYRQIDKSWGSAAERYQATSIGLKNQDGSGSGFVNSYTLLARSAAKTGSFRTILQHILQHPDDPILVHCTIGKDRTGAIATDYALTSEGLGSWREYMIQHALQTGELETREQAEYILGSRKEYMLSFLESFEKEFGGARKYFVDLCGMQNSELDKIIASMVVPGYD